MRLLGGFELRNERMVVPLPLPAQRVLAFLALKNRSHFRSTVAATLWSNVSEERAAANLRSALWKIRRSSPSLVVSSGYYLRLSDGVDVDVASFVDRAQRLMTPELPLDDVDADVATFADDLLPGWDEEWLVVEREALRQLRMHALEALCRRLSAEGRHAEAVHAGQVAVAADPLRESGQRALLEAHLAEGNASEAIRQFHLYREALEECLGLQPSRDLVSLIGVNRRLRMA